MKVLKSRKGLTLIELLTSLAIGATIDDYFRAFDARTGEELWATKLHASAHSVPITYEGKDGKQYVVVMAGGGHSGSPTRAAILYAFALP